MKTKSLLGFTLIAILFMGAAPTESGYGEIPQKREAVESNQYSRTVRDEAVRPEEVYKYGVQDFSIIVSDTGYFPDKLIVRKGIPVHIKMTSASSSPYCFVLDEFNVRKGIPTQDVVEVRFLPMKADTYRFYCPKQEIEGKIIVRD